MLTSRRYLGPSWAPSLASTSGGRLRHISGLLGPAGNPPLRRSVLFVPGASEKHIKKVPILDCDAVILDLEDAVAPDKKVEARDTVVRALQEVDFGSRDVVVRVNSLDTAWGRRDIAAVAEQPQLYGICLPKVESEAMLRDAQACVHRAGGSSSLPLWAMIETPLGILRAPSLPTNVPELECYVAGTNDLGKELHSRPTASRQELMLSLSAIVLAARAHGLTCLDGVYRKVHADDEFWDVCEQGRDLGFDGKTLIHPSTIAPCNEAFSPDGDEIDHAARVVIAFVQAEAEGDGVVVVNGSLVENLHVVNAVRTLAMADRAGLINPHTAKEVHDVLGPAVSTPAMSRILGSMMH